jgi:prephenate dehydratase
MPAATLRYAYLGPQGTFAEAALRTLPAAAHATLVPLPSVLAALEAVRADQADGAMVPLENSVEGAVTSTLDELAGGSPLVIAAEVYLPVTFALLVRAGTLIDAVKSVATHPHAEAQCRRWLRSRLPDAEVHLVGSTSAGAVGAAAGEFDASISAPIAAATYGLVPLATDLADNPGAITRFVLLTRPGLPPERTGQDRTSLVAFIREDHTGALLEVLTEFAVRGINLTRIESRPTKARLGHYCFSLDCEGHIADARVGDALAALHRICADVRYLGSYQRADGQPGEPIRPGATDRDFAAAASWLARVRASGIA